jgi:Alkaline phosphatase PhoX
MRRRRHSGIVTVVAALAVGGTVMSIGDSVSAGTSIKPYVEAVGPEYEVRALLSVGDVVPETSDPSRQFRMAGIPDGLGAYPNSDGTQTLFMSHEANRGATPQPLVGAPRYRGAFVSKWILDADGDVVSGERAYDSVFIENTFVGPAAQANNSTPAFARFCSGFLAGPDVGFDRWIYFANEEEASPTTFDTLGGLSVAIFDNEAHGLPKLGRMEKENSVVQDAGARARTVIFSLNDGPPTLDNQLYMYVGKKDRSEGASALARNGLDNGELYVFRSLHPLRNDERTFTDGSIQGEWVLIPDAEAMTDDQLEAASDAVGAMTFVRLEDGAFNPRNRNELFFVSTGNSSGVDDGVNELGRFYSLRLHSSRVLKHATLAIVYNADSVVAEGGDTALSPDNVDTNEDYLMIAEDGTGASSPVMEAKGRYDSVWRFDLGRGPVGVDASSATRIAEVDPPGRGGVPAAPGDWEVSGIINTSGLFGPDTWLADVQTTSQLSPLLNDGQLFLLRPAD